MDYEVSFKCNMVERPEVDLDFFSFVHDAKNSARFDALIIAEGDWSKTSKRLGFVKKIDKFNQAIGIVINMEFERSNLAEKKLKSFINSRFSVDWNQGPLGKLLALELACENIEYLKGSTHYVVVTIDKESLISRKVLKQDFNSSLELLQSDNLNIIDCRKRNFISLRNSRICSLLQIQSCADF